MGNGFSEYLFMYVFITDIHNWQMDNHKCICEIEDIHNSNMDIHIWFYRYP